MLKTRYVRWVTIGFLTLFPLVASTRTWAQEDKAQFHHVHLNVLDPAKSVAFYRKFFSGVPIMYRGLAPAVLTDRSFILFNKVATAAPSELLTAIYHIGWGGIDGPSEYEWRKKEGVEFETPGTPLGRMYFAYAYGPDREVIEVWTGFHHNRFGHVHLFADDVNATARWYMDHLGLKGPTAQIPKPPPFPADYKLDPGDPGVFRYLWASQVSTEAVTINIFGKPGPDRHPWWNYEPLKELLPTDGRVIDHMAFSFRKIEPVFEKMKAAGLEIIHPIAEHPEYKFKSFFVRGPDKVLVEVVEEKPIPEGIWD